MRKPKSIKSRKINDTKVMKIKKISLLLAITLLVACGNAPKCDNEEVKKLAIKAAVQSYLKQARLSDKATMAEYLRGDNDAFKKANDISDGMINSVGDFAKLLGGKPDSAYLVTIDSTLQKGEIMLKGIRITENNEELKKCGCEANIYFKDIYYKVSYTAQKTEDGNIYVESIVMGAE